MTNKQIAGQSLVYWNGPTNQFIFTWCGFRVLNAYKLAGANSQTNPLAATTVAQGKSPDGASLSANGNLASSAGKIQLVSRLSICDLIIAGRTKKSTTV